MLHFPLIILPHLIQGWPTCGFKATARYWVIEVDSHNGNTAYYWQHTAGVRITFFISTSMWEEALRGFWDQQLPTSFGTQLSTQLHPFPCWVLGPPGTYCCFLPGRYLLKNPSPYLKYWVGVWHLLDIGSFILFFFLRCSWGQEFWVPMILVSCILESLIWVQVELSHITRSGNRFSLQLPHELVYVWKRQQRSYVRRKLLRLLSQVLKN